MNGNGELQREESVPAGEFGFEGAVHDVFDGLEGAFVFVEDFVDLFGDGHFDAEFLGEVVDALGGFDAFGDDVGFGEDLLECHALAEFDADGAVAAEAAGAGEDEVAHAGQSGEGEGVGAHADGESGDFVESAGDHAGGGVVAEIHAADGAGSDGDDVFDCAANFDADDVVGGVAAESVGAENLLHFDGQAVVVGGDGDGGGFLLGDFAGEARAGEVAEEGVEAGGQGVFHDVGNEHEGFVFDAFGGADNRNAFGHGGGGGGEDVAQNVAWGHGDDHVFVAHALLDVGGGAQVAGQVDFGQVEFVFVFLVDLGSNFGFKGPDFDLKTFVGQYFSECGSPGSSADYSDIHDRPVLVWRVL